MAKRDVTFTDWIRKRALSRMIREYKEINSPYYKVCIDANDILCYKCGKSVGTDVVRVKSTSSTVSFRRYYDKKCHDELYL